ncbi:MAG: TIGR03936 family radical SAM-associated protein [Phycisphaerae bacterium]
MELVNRKCGITADLRRWLGIRFSIEGDLRFISHHDTVRMFERGLARAELPVKRSGGFNPRMQLSLPLPRSVGIAGLAELLIVEMTEPVEPDEALRRLSGEMPADVRLRSIEAYSDGGPRAATSAKYAIDLPEAAAMSPRVEAFLARQQSEVERRDAKTGAVRRIDVRSFVSDVRLEDGRLEWTQTMRSGATARPAEVLAALGLDPQETLHRVTRVAVEFHRT